MCSWMGTGWPNVSRMDSDGDSVGDGRNEVLLQNSWLEPAVSGRRPATGIYRFGASGMIEAGDVPRNKAVDWRLQAVGTGEVLLARLQPTVSSPQPVRLTAGGHKAINPVGLGAKPSGNHQLLWRRTKNDCRSRPSGRANSRLPRSTIATTQNPDHRLDRSLHSRGRQNTGISAALSPLRGSGVCGRPGTRGLRPVCV